MPPRLDRSRFTLLLTLVLLGGCALPPPLPAEGQTTVWRGRLALRVDSEPPQSFFAAFELRGQPGTGELQLFSPLGSTLARLQWSPRSATLHNNGEIRRFDSLEALAIQATGADIPIAALFDWLVGREVQADGWTADLSRLAEGRLLARRSQPAPLSELRLILEP